MKAQELRAIRTEMLDTALHYQMDKCNQLGTSNFVPKAYRQTRGRKLKKTAANLSSSFSYLCPGMEFVTSLHAVAFDRAIHIHLGKKGQRQCTFPDCGKVFRNRTAYCQHFDKVHSIKPFYCPCPAGGSFAERCQFVTHLKSKNNCTYQHKDVLLELLELPHTYEYVHFKELCDLLHPCSMSLTFDDLLKRAKALQFLKPSEQSGDGMPAPKDFIYLMMDEIEKKEYDLTDLRNRTAQTFDNEKIHRENEDLAEGKPGVKRLRYQSDSDTVIASMAHAVPWNRNSGFQNLRYSLQPTAPELNTDTVDGLPEPPNTNSNLGFLLDLLELEVGCFKNLFDSMLIP